MTDCDRVRERARLTVDCCARCHRTAEEFEVEDEGHHLRVCCAVASALTAAHPIKPPRR